MASLLDTGLLKQFDFFFPFLLIFLLVYVGLSRFEALKEKKSVCGLIAFLLALIALTSDFVVKVINKMAPFFIILIVFLIFLLMVYQAMGIEEKTITNIFTNSEHSANINNWLIAIILIIGIGSAVTVFSEEEGFLGLTGDENTDEELSFWTSLLHPKMLGMILILIVGMLTVQKLTSDK